MFPPDRAGRLQQRQQQLDGLQERAGRLPGHQPGRVGSVRVLPRAHPQAAHADRACAPATSLAGRSPTCTTSAGGMPSSSSARRNGAGCGLRAARPPISSEITMWSRRLSRRERGDLGALDPRVAVGDQHDGHHGLQVVEGGQGCGVGRQAVRRVPAERGDEARRRTAPGRTPIATSARSMMPPRSDPSAAMRVSTRRSAAPSRPRVPARPATAAQAPASHSAWGKSVSSRSTQTPRTGRLGHDRRTTMPTAERSRGELGVARGEQRAQVRRRRAPRRRGRPCGRRRRGSRSAATRASSSGSVSRSTAASTRARVEAAQHRRAGLDTLPAWGGRAHDHDRARRGRTPPPAARRCR